MSTPRLGLLLSRWVSGCRRFAWAVVLVALALGGWSLEYTRSNIRFDTDTADMIARDLPWRQTFIAYKEAFPQFVDTLLLVVDGDNPDVAEDAADRLAGAIRGERSLVEWVERPGDSDFFRRHALLYLDEDELARLADSLSRVQPFLGALAGEPTLPGLFSLLEKAMNADRRERSVPLTPVLEAVADAVEAEQAGRFHRLSWQNLMQAGVSGGNDTRRYIVVKPKLDFSELDPAGRVMARIRALVTAHGLDPDRGVRVRITGEPALSHEELASVTRGTGVALVLALIMVTAVLLVGLRSVWLLVATVVTLLLGLFLTAAFATAAIGHLNLISIAFAVLYIGLGVDYAIHYCLRCRELRIDGIGWADALDHGARDVGAALVICAVTTGIGFFAFVPTAFTGVSELGIISGTGMFISLIATLTLLPALLELLPHGRWKNAEAIAGAAGLEQLESWPRRHRRSVRAAAVVLGLGALAVAPFARFDDNPLNLRDPLSESVATLRDLMANGDRSPWRISVMAAGPDEARALSEKIEALPAVGRVISLHSLVPEGQERKLVLVDDLQLTLALNTVGISRDTRSDPEVRHDATQALVASLQAFADETGVAAERAQSLRLASALANLLGKNPLAGHLAALEQSLMHFLPSQLERLEAALSPDRITLETLPAGLARDWRASDGSWRLEVQPAQSLDDARALERFVSSVRTVAPDATGAPIVHLESGRAVVAAFVQALTFALLLISVLVFLVMRSATDVGLVLAPLLLAMLLTVAAMVVLGVPFNFANVIALPLLLGLGANNGIHMVHRLRAAPPPSGDLLKTSTARGVVFSALTTLCSFGNLAFTAHRGTASMGLLLALGLSLVLLCTLVLTPALQPRK